MLMELWRKSWKYFHDIAKTRIEAEFTDLSNSTDKQTQVMMILFVDLARKKWNFVIHWQMAFNDGTSRSHSFCDLTEICKDRRQYWRFGKTAIGAKNAARIRAIRALS
jgi:hypothetical protein